MLQVPTHAMVLGGQEHGVQDDAEGHYEVKHRVVDELEENVLKPEPALVVEATLFTATAVTVCRRF